MRNRGDAYDFIMGPIRKTLFFFEMKSLFQIFGSNTPLN